MIYIFDTDGTLADLTHRLHFIQQFKPDWNAFFMSAENDQRQRGLLMGYLEKLEKNKQDFMVYCSRGHFLKQSGDPSFSGGKTVVIDNSPGECPECDKEVLEAQSIMGRMGIPKENK